MATPDVGSSPNDWPETYPQLRNLDTMLRCGICFEFMDTALILPQCSHNYCSLCIRRYIGYKPQCPACAKNVSQTDLKNNRIIDDIIKTFTELRSSLLKLVVSSHSQSASDVLHLTTGTAKQKKAPEMLMKQRERRTQKKAKETATDHKTSSLHVTQMNSYTSNLVSLEDSESSNDFPLQQPRPLVTRVSSEAFEVETDEDMFWSDEEDDVLRSQNQKCTPKRPALNPCDLPADLSLNTSSSNMTSPSAFTSQSTISSPTSSMFSMHRSPVTRVNCPVCGVSIPERHINMHLDQCLRGGPKLVAPVLTVSKAPVRKPLPKLVYNLMKDAELKKRLTDVCLPTQGDRQTLIRRHQDYTVLYNSQCDSFNPMSPADVAKAVVENEKCKIKFTKAPSSAQKFGAKKGDNEETVSHAQRQYVKRHKSQFSNLLSQAKRRIQELREKPKRPASAMQSSDDFKCQLGNDTLISGDRSLPVNGFSGVMTDSEYDCSLCDDVPVTQGSDVTEKTSNSLDSEASDCKYFAQPNNKPDIDDSDVDSDTTVDINEYTMTAAEEEEERETGSGDMSRDHTDKEQDEISTADNCHQEKLLHDSDVDFEPMKTRRKRKATSSVSGLPKGGDTQMKKAQRTIPQDDTEPYTTAKTSTRRQLRTRNIKTTK